MWWGARPQRCLKIGAEELVWVHARSRWGRRRPHRCSVRPLAPGQIRLSPMEPNLIDESAVETAVRELIAPPRFMRVLRGDRFSRVPRPITLLLPDLCVRTVVFRLDRIPAKRSERDALIRWRFGQDHLFPLNGATVCHQLLPSLDPRSKGQGATVLAVAIQDAVRRQYEGLCQAVGLVPIDVTTPSFQLCNVWLASQDQATPARPVADFLWLSLLDRTFTLCAFHRGQPVFTRSKLLGPTGAGGLDRRLDAEQLEWIASECEASLRLYEEQGVPGQPSRLVVVADEGSETLQAGLQERLSLEVVSFDWTVCEPMRWRIRGKDLPASAMAAIASVC